MADMSTASSGRRLPKTSSRSLTESVTATHDFHVTGYSLLDGMGAGKFVQSSTFAVDGFEWFLTFFPDGDRYPGHASAYLELGSGPVYVNVRYRIRLLEKDGSESHQVANHAPRRSTFKAPSGDWGGGKFFNKASLQTSPYLINDCLTIRCTLTIIKESRTEGLLASPAVVPQSSLLRELEQMLESGKGADVEFRVGGQLFRAHSCVLAARSPVFEAGLFGQMKETVSRSIEIDDMEPSVFEALLHFIYTDALPDTCEGGKIIATMQHLLVAADRYGLDRLRAMCEGRLYDGIGVETVATTVALAEQHHCPQLRAACVGFMASPDVLVAVMETDGFKHLIATCPSILKEILDKVPRV